MSAVLLAVFNDFETAERVRIDLVRDGFPTDRVDLTACCDPGRAGFAPADSPHEKFVQHFSRLFGTRARRDYVELLAQRVDGGAATVTVHPRGMTETARATELLVAAGAAEIVPHDLENQRMERAAADHDGPWIRHLWLEKGDTDCIYCRLFPASHSH